MYRRRKRRTREIAFGLDSFLDVISNVIGIIIRMILVVWVGARAYYAMQPVAPVKVDLPKVAKKKLFDPLEKMIPIRQKELASVQKNLHNRIQVLPILEKDRGRIKKQFQELKSQRRELTRELQVLSNELADIKPDQSQSIQLATFHQRSQKLKKDIAAIQNQPRKTNVIYFRTPVSRPVTSEEFFFECKRNRVSYIAIATFVEDMKSQASRRVDELKTRWTVEGYTRQVGAFRMKYILRREKSLFDQLVTGEPNPNADFRYGLQRMTLQPLALDRGESLQKSMQPDSTFRGIVSRLDPKFASITMWVYPDSFPLYRHLRDYLTEQGFEVAGRPIPDGVPIGLSRHGTISRGQ